jgi:hypothetical protein
VVKSGHVELSTKARRDLRRLARGPDRKPILDALTVSLVAIPLRSPGAGGAGGAGCREVKRDGTAGLVGCMNQPAAAGGTIPAGEVGRLPRSRLTVATAGTLA